MEKENGSYYLGFRVSGHNLGGGPTQYQSIKRSLFRACVYSSEQQSVFPIQFIGHGFHIRTIFGTVLNYKRVPVSTVKWPLGKANIDSSSSDNSHPAFTGWGHCPQLYFACKYRA